MRRPIGTEFDLGFPPSPHEGRQYFRIIRYKVVGYGTPTTETIEPVRISDFPVKEWVYWFGQFRPVPPLEILPLLDNDWTGVFKKAEGSLHLQNSI